MNVTVRRKGGDARVSLGLEPRIRRRGADDASAYLLFSGPFTVTSFARAGFAQHLLIHYTATPPGGGSFFALTRCRQRFLQRPTGTRTIPILFSSAPLRER